LASLAIVLLVMLFILVKSPPLAERTSALLRFTAGQSTELASAVDLTWLGFSFLAFRLLHVLRDYQAEKLPSYDLADFVTYAVFFPSYTSGPIDRSQHFIPQLDDLKSKDFDNWHRIYDGGTRIVVGIFKKFVLADSLALFALNAQNAGQVHSSTWLWVMLYGYALRIYLDFSGYTDIAIGIAVLFGIRLPENFNRPYLKTSLTAFWNSWHITLAQWFRAYVFNPLTRYLRTRPEQVPAWLVILAGQMVTMLLIGLWHGITWNFVMWGLWHGAGLFINNRWSGWVKPRMDTSTLPDIQKKGLSFVSWFLTFNYVALGWVWFVLPDLSSSLDVFRTLFGLG
jgi:D-alanyl-lipoteichoic acid acyltransferase DltB (MBOAT superfamily)